MTIPTKNGAKVEACDGNKAAAYGVLLCRPDVIAMYPITPQTAMIEWLTRFHDQGLLDAEVVHVEGENSSMGAVTGACVAGGRVFTATSSWGLAFMYDGLFNASGNRVPVVMVNVTREMPGLPCLGSSNQDIMSVRDTGWVQIDVESCQEILDSIIMAYRIAEDPDILLPVMVCYDGFYLSYLVDRVEIPQQADVDSFLAPLSKAGRIKLGSEPSTHRHFGPHCDEETCTEFRYKHSAALERVKQKVDLIDTEFERNFGRSYGGQIEEYRNDDAEIVLVIMGSSTGTAKVVVDKMRDEGKKVGLIKIRLLRPFPKERLAQALKGKKAAGVLDKSVCFGWNCGHIFMELKSVLYEAGIFLPIVDFIDGLANTDVTKEHIERAVELTYSAYQGKPVKEVTWLALE